MTDKEIDQLLAASGDTSALNPETSAKIRSLIASGTPVNPLPPALVLTAIFYALFLLVAVAGGLSIGPHGFRLMTSLQRIAIFCTLAAVAFWVSVTAARSMRPGSGLLYGGTLAALSLLVPEIIFFSVFHDYDTSRFVPAGLVCLGIGLAFSVPTVWLTRLLMRRGFAVQPLTAGMLAGLAGGLTGLTFLELHCPLLTVPHSAVWHVAVVAVSLAVGIALAYYDSYSHDNRGSTDNRSTTREPGLKP